ncbi:tissue-type plasminogen activator isoform X3 [Hippoglossus stenolepis]|uniref:tissue-type plasminogen activator isoform X3 n=1 Tax=Hippoglossus stenolepis TaxID=195615 RepID=UPI001FB02D64|nr:tissue-type plasminogen activator isoform X3 [Hippoglossus stenolepis]
MTRSLGLLILLSALCCGLADNVRPLRSKRGTRFYRDCYVSRCYNGGMCKEAVYTSDYICQCPAGFSGAQCEINTKEKCVVGRGEGYRGTWSIGHSGAECINWNATSLRGKRFTARKVDATSLGLGNHNFCRNPDNDSNPWCYIYKGTQIVWELCSVPKCPEDKYQECTLGSGQSYRGTASVTKSGSSCLPWDSPAVNRKHNNAWRSDALELGLGSHSFCRNPDADDGPWCHTYKDMKLIWELCNIPKCLSITTLFPRAPTRNNNNGATCGQRLDNSLNRPAFRIFGGRETDITDQPWQAAINVYQARSKHHFHRCGGVLIDSCWVLSAAHCFEEKDKAEKLQVILGRTFRKQNSSSEQIFEVEKYWSHEKFDNESFDNDIVLLKLKTDIGICAINSPEVLPVCLPEPELSLPSWTECEISGYGRDQEFAAEYSKRVKRGYVRLWPNERCVPDVLSGRPVTPNMLCAGDTRGLDDACKGDSGGPLVCRNKDRMTLMGVISWGDGCGQRDKPGVYTRVTNYISWINGIMKANPV